MKEIFVTATDTDAGKTFVSCALIQALINSPLHSQQLTSTGIESKTSNSEKHVLNGENKTHFTVAAFKPISAGCELINGQLINEDAKLLCEFANAKQTIQQINPIAFADPIAPHIAAKKENKLLSITAIKNHYSEVKNLNADVTLTEGAGGWRLPLGVSSDLYSSINEKNRYQYLSDFAKQSNVEVVLIVNMKLGCLNHALLTFESIKADGLNCIAWIANCASSNTMNNLSENISELEQLLPIPKIAQFDFFDDVDEEGKEMSFNDKISLAAKQINIEPLLK